MDKKLLESLCSSQNDAEIFEDEIAESADWDYTRSFLINVSTIIKLLAFDLTAASLAWDSDCHRNSFSHNSHIFHFHLGNATVQ